MTRDSKGNDISNVELPIGSRTIIGPTSRQISVNSLKNANYYPTGSGWYEIGLKVESGGPKWIIDSVAPASNFVSTRTAIAQRDVNVTLNIIGAEYSSIIFKLQTGKSANSKNFSSISQPQKQKQWIVFHEDEYKSGRKRRRVGIATAKVEESRHERGAPLEFEITFDFLPIIVTKLGEGNEVIGGKEVGVIPGGSSVGIDIPGSGMPGSGGGDYASDGGFDINDGTVDTSTPTLPSPGADVGSDKTNEIDIHPDDAEFGEVGDGGDGDGISKEEKKNNDKPGVIDGIMPEPNGELPYIKNFSGNTKGIGSGGSSSIKVSPKDILFSPIVTENSISVSEFYLYHNSSKNALDFNFVFGIYGSSIDGDVGNLIKERKFTIDIERYSELKFTIGENYGDRFIFNPGIYFIAIKNCGEDDFSINGGYKIPYPLSVSLKEVSRGLDTPLLPLKLTDKSINQKLPNSIKKEDIVGTELYPIWYLKTEKE